MKTIGFPAPLLGEQALRLNVLAEQAGALVLEKPQGVLGDAHPWYTDTPDLARAFQKQVDEGKPELEAFGFKRVRSVFFQDAEATGAVILSGTAEANETLRNEYGSNVCTFTYQFLARSSRTDREAFTCELPLAQHFEEPRMFISHKTGKKACTHFRFLGAYGYYELWEAAASFMRPHQIRYHAADQGLVIVGEYLYGEELPLLLSQFKRKYTGRDRERPLYEGLYLHMTSLSMPFWGEEPVSIPLPKKFQVMLKKIEGATKR